MPNPDWGVKRTCPSCATRFYDLMREPVTCPECDTVIDLSKPAKGSPLTVATAAAAAKAKAKEAEAAKPLVDDEETSDDDLLVDDDDDDDDDDAADVGNDADSDNTASGGPALSDENSDDEPVEFDDAVLLDEDEDDDDDLDSIDVKPRKDEEG